MPNHLRFPEREREKFNQLYARYEAEVRKEQGWMPTMSLSYLDQTATDRVAISKALTDVVILLSGGGE